MHLLLPLGERGQDQLLALGRVGLDGGARGKVVDTDALLAETTSGRLRAALDVGAAAYGDAELITPASAWLMAKFHDLAPALTADLGGLAERTLPAPAAGGTARRAGHEVSDGLPGWARAVQDRAVGTFNQGERFAP